MLGILYLLISFLVGKEIAEVLPLKQRMREGNRVNRFWLLLAASYGIGVLLVTWAVYIVSWIAGSMADVRQPLLYGNLLVGLLCAVYLAAVYFRRKKAGKKVLFWGGISDRASFRKERIFFGLLLILVSWIMFYVFYIRDGVLYSGFTVYGDYAPHTAMIRSFSWGNNFPTQYPHYGGQDVRYHFMFQFLAGNLEYLGLRLDFAYNLISIGSLTGFFMVLYSLARRLGGGFLSGGLAVGFFVFRSGTAFFRFVLEHLRAGDLPETLWTNTSFIGYTPNENWGLWNFNVYLNQRHLAFGLLLVGVAVWVYLDWVEEGCRAEEKGIAWIRRLLFTKQAWKTRDLSAALLLGMLLGLCSFWNGAAVIGGLLILLGFTFFSYGKLDYAVTAAAAVLFSGLQSRMFVWGEVVSPSLYFGFLAEEKTIAGVLRYVFSISGFFFLGLAVLVFFMRRRQRAVVLGCMLPMVFAFCVSLTPDINVNHKYVMISYAFLTVFWGRAAELLWAKQKRGFGKAFLTGKRIAAVLLIILLTATGIYDFAVLLMGNDGDHRVGVYHESALTSWLGENLEKDDLILTPEYSMSEVTMSGVMLYCGWPYYAWSAGYDTNYRAARAVEIYTAENEEELKGLVEQEKITYILFEEDMEFEQVKCREDVIASAYPLVYTSEDGRIRIYEAG